MSQHMPLPWGLYVDNEAFLIQRTSDFSPVARTESRSAEAAADAEFIIRACNSHTELLEALKALISSCEDLGGEAFPDTWASINKARAAITKAEGRS